MSQDTQVILSEKQDCAYAYVSLPVGVCLYTAHVHPYPPYLPLHHNYHHYFPFQGRKIAGGGRGGGGVNRDSRLIHVCMHDTPKII